MSMDPAHSAKPSSLRLVLHSHAVDLGNLLHTGQISKAAVELLANQQKSLRESFTDGKMRTQFPLDVFAALQSGKRVNFADKTQRLSCSAEVNAAKVAG